MAARLTRVTLSIPWDDEGQSDHPAAWGWDVLLGIDNDPLGREITVVDFEDLNPDGTVQQV